MLLKSLVKIIKYFEYLVRNKGLVSYCLTAYWHATYIHTSNHVNAYFGV